MTIFVPAYKSLASFNVTVFPLLFADSANIRGKAVTLQSNPYSALNLNKTL